MVTTQSKLDRGGQARALRWTCALSLLALVGCALPRRDAPPTRSRSIGLETNPGGSEYRVSVEGRPITVEDGR